MPVDGSLKLILPEIIVAVTALVALAAGLLSRNRRMPGILSLLGLAGAAYALATQVVGTTAEIWSGTVLVDGYGALFKAIFLGIAFLIVLMSFDFVDRRQLPAGEFHMLMLLATVGMMFMAGSLNLVTIYLGLESLAMASYALTGMLRGSQRSTESALKFILIGAISSGIVLFGMSLVFGVAGSVHLTDISAALAGAAAMRPVLLAGIMFLVTGFGVKMALVPFHMWAPDVYDGAPAPVAAFLITASEAAAFAAALRVFMVGMPSLAGDWKLVFIVLAVITMTFGNISAIVQTSIRRMLAYSAVAQAGYIVLGLAIATPTAVSAMLYYILAYAFTTLGAFAVVILMSRYHETENIRDFAGLGQRAPLFAGAFSLFMLSFIGIPPTGGFFGKFFLYQAAVSNGMAWLALIVVVNSIISVPYYWGVVRTIYLTDTEDVTPMVAPAGVRLALIIGLVGTLVLGLFPDQVIQVVNAIQVVPASLGF